MNKKNNWKKYLPVIFLLLFVALVIIALIVAQGISRRAPIAPTAPVSRPGAAACLLSFSVLAPVVTPTPTPSPTPTATPSGSPTPTPTAAPDQGGFFIRKYNDHNGNGTQDTGDEGLSWKFQWSKDGGSTWNDYDTFGNKLGEGGVVYLDTGTKVTIREVAVSGWTATTPTTVDLTIKTGENQLMVFGNWQPVAATPTPTPAPRCNSVCGTNSDCPSGMSCVSGACRNPNCSTQTNCVCPSTPRPTVAPTPTPTPEQLPKSGVIDDTLKLVGAGAGAIILGLVALLAL